MTAADRFLQQLEIASAQRSPLIMGICNVTPDSFSDGGQYFARDAAERRVDELLAEGADVIDVGGESTRPGAPPVSVDEQIGRTVAVVRYAAARALVSIDTAAPEVAEACLAAGACVVNDVSCLRDERLARVSAAHGAALVLMHARGLQGAMRAAGVPVQGYDDVVEDVLREWHAAAQRAEAQGLPRTRLVFDPGLGFAKRNEDSMELLLALERCTARLGVPSLVGASRKSFLRLVDADAAPSERLGGSIAAALLAQAGGAGCVRVHDVKATRQALKLMHLARNWPAPSAEHADA